jgi:3-hydroxyisobutyrate dehydrogenase
MGNPVAGNLLAAGHDLVVHDLRPHAAVNLLAAGARWARSPAELAHDAEVVFVSLPSHLEVEQVCFGPGGLFQGLRAGTYLIDLTTGSVSSIPRIVGASQLHGIHYLTAPVSQGVDNARIGKLSVFVGGDRSDCEYCLPLFNVIAAVVIHTGDHHSAMAAKLVTNLLWFTGAVAIGEALVLGAKAGIDLPVLREAILNSCGSSWVAEHDLGSIFSGSFDPSFTTGLCRKDLALTAELAAEHQLPPLALASTVTECFRQAEIRFGPDSPELSVVRHLQERTGTTLQVSVPVSTLRVGLDDAAGGVRGIRGP